MHHIGLREHKDEAGRRGMRKLNFKNIFTIYILWAVDRVWIMHPIQTESKGIRPISCEGKASALSVYTYLKNPMYQVRAHFIPNPYRTEAELIADGHNENKHFDMAKRMVEKGGRRDIYPGTRECQGNAEPCAYGDGQGSYEY